MSIKKGQTKIITGAMAKHVCAKCGAKFDFPSKLRRHMERKTPCAPIIDAEDMTAEYRARKYNCRFCGRRFRTQTACLNHVQNSCKIIKTPGGMDILYEHTRRKCEIEHEKRMAAESKLNTLERQLLEMTTSNPAAMQPQIHINVGNLEIHNTINVNIFGEEDTSHIGRKQVRILLDEALKRMASFNPTHSNDSEKPPQEAIQRAAVEALTDAARMIYNDPNHPENITCYMRHQEDSYALVHVSKDGEPSWEIRPCDRVTRPMTKQVVDLLFRNQPFDRPEPYEIIMVELRDKEDNYYAEQTLRPVLTENKKLLEAIKSHR